MPTKRRAKRVITVALVEDDPDIRQGLSLLINETEGFRCTKVYGDAESAVSGLLKDPPDVVLMDIQLPRMSGIEAVQALRSAQCTTDIIMLTIHKDDQLVFESLCAGASGYLLKSTRPEKLLDAIREVVDGGAPMSSHIARMIVQSFRRTTASPLTARETEVLAQLCKGQSYKMIADVLRLSEETVHHHIKSIYRKLQVHSNTEAISKAIHNKLV